MVVSPRVGTDEGEGRLRGRGGAVDDGREEAHLSGQNARVSEMAGLGEEDGRWRDEHLTSVERVLLHGRIPGEGVEGAQRDRGPLGRGLPLPVNYYGMPGIHRSDYDAVVRSSVPVDSHGRRSSHEHQEMQPVYAHPASFHHDPIRAARVYTTHAQEQDSLVREKMEVLNRMLRPGAIDQHKMLMEMVVEGNGRSANAQVQMPHQTPPQQLQQPQHTKEQKPGEGGKKTVTKKKSDAEKSSVVKKKSSKAVARKGNATSHTTKRSGKRSPREEQRIEKRERMMSRFDQSENTSSGKNTGSGMSTGSGKSMKSEDTGSRKSMKSEDTGSGKSMKSEDTGSRKSMKSEKSQTSERSDKSEIEKSEKSDKSGIRENAETDSSEDSGKKKSYGRAELEEMKRRDIGESAKQKRIEAKKERRRVRAEEKARNAQIKPTIVVLQQEKKKIEERIEVEESEKESLTEKKDGEGKGIDVSAVSEREVDSHASNTVEEDEVYPDTPITVIDDRMDTSSTIGAEDRMLRAEGERVDQRETCQREDSDPQAVEAVEAVEAGEAGEVGEAGVSSRVEKNAADMETAITISEEEEGGEKKKEECQSARSGIGNDDDDPCTPTLQLEEEVLPTSETFSTPACNVIGNTTDVKIESSCNIAERKSKRGRGKGWRKKLSGSAELDQAIPATAVHGGNHHGRAVVVLGGDAREEDGNETEEMVCADEGSDSLEKSGVASLGKREVGTQEAAGREGDRAEGSVRLRKRKAKRIAREASPRQSRGHYQEVSGVHIGASVRVWSFQKMMCFLLLMSLYRTLGSGCGWREDEEETITDHANFFSTELSAHAFSGVQVS